MASGQELKEKNLKRFKLWEASKSDEEFKQYVHRGQLNRTDIAAECEFGRSAIGQNPDIRDALANLETRLRAKGILPELIENKDQVEPAKPAGQKEERRARRLEIENAMLKAELEKYKKFKVMEDIMTETMRIPRDECSIANKRV